MFEYLRRLTDERTQLTETVTRTADAAATEDRDLTDVERTLVTSAQERCAFIDEQLTTYNAGLEGTRAYAQLLDRIEQNGTEARTPGRAASTSTLPALESTSWGQTFIESDAFRSYSGHGQSGVVDLSQYLELRAPITTAQLSIPHFVLPPVVYETRAPLLEVCGRVTVSSGVVDWVELGGDPQAAVVAEGAQKPEAAFTATPKSSALDTIAHWIQITRQALDDAPYIQSIIEGKLRRGLLNKAEADMATAIDAATLPTAAGATLLEAIRVGIGTVEAAGFVPNAVALNPADYAALDIAVMGGTTAGPVVGVSFWGMKPVAAGAIPSGKAYVGDFASGATLFDRGVTSVFLSDSHSSLFISNVLVILAEARLKSAVTEPLALCECAATP